MKAFTGFQKNIRALVRAFSCAFAGALETFSRNILQTPLRAFIIIRIKSFQKLFCQKL